MQGTYDQTFSLMHSSSKAFLRAQNRILHLIKYRATVNKLNSRFLYKTNDFNKNTSIAVRKTLCPKCSEDQEFCEEGRDSKRRYYCKVLSHATGEHVRLYFPSQNDIDNKKEQLKRAIMQTVARNPGASQNKLFSFVRGDKRLFRECLNELIARGLLRCSEQNEHNCLVKRHYIVFD
jgi:hypothetical protein